MSISDRFGEGPGKVLDRFWEGLEEVLGGSGSMLGAFGCFWGGLGRLLGVFASLGLHFVCFCCHHVHETVVMNNFGLFVHCTLTGWI